MNMVFLVMIGMFIILMFWSWHNLGNVENKTKFTIIAISSIVIYILTLVIYNISKNDEALASLKPEYISKIKNILVILFSLVNGYILMPHSFRRINQINNDEITSEKLKRSIVIMLVIFVLVIIFECNYLQELETGLAQQILQYNK